MQHPVALQFGGQTRFARAGMLLIIAVGSKSDPTKYFPRVSRTNGHELAERIVMTIAVRLGRRRGIETIRYLDEPVRVGSLVATRADR